MTRATYSPTRSIWSSGTRVPPRSRPAGGGRRRGPPVPGGREPGGGGGHRGGDREPDLTERGVGGAGGRRGQAGAAERGAPRGGVGQPVVERRGDRRGAGIDGVERDRVAVGERDGVARD